MAELPIEPGLRERFRKAGPAIQWRPLPRRGNSTPRVAHLNDEEARVEQRKGKGGRTVWAEPGPLGALVLLLEIDAAGAPGFVAALDAAPPAFPKGALVAGWAQPIPAKARALPLSDLVTLARYALA